MQFHKKKYANGFGVWKIENRGEGGVTPKSETA
jgi:hypothetical protein